MSRYLSPVAIAGLNRLGDVLVPGDGDLPRFSRSGAAAEVDRMLDGMHNDDRSGLKLLLTLFGLLPRFLVRVIYACADRGRHFPGVIGAPFRLVHLGTKGLIMTLYWSDAAAAADSHDVIGFKARVVRDDEPAIAEVVRKPAPEPLVPADASAARGAMLRARAGAVALARLTMPERVRYVRELRRVVLARREEIISRIQADTGKTRSDALISEVYGALENLVWLEGHGPRHLRDHKEHTPLAMFGKGSWTWFEPLGTVLVISPWNYPFYQALVPIASSLLTGNTIVYKPSEWTPLEGLLEDILSEAGVPASWVQIVYGDGAVGAELIAERPDKIFFTGSTRTGRRILEAAAPALIPVELELGGKDAMIVFADADVGRASAGCAWGALTNTGQSCTSVERVYIERPIYDRFRDALLTEVGRVKQEIDTDGDADIGAMTTDFQVDIVAAQLADARANGAVIHMAKEWDGHSRMIPPIVIEGVDDGIDVAAEETFGPLITLFPFDSESEVVRRTNDSPYGLTASVWSHDGKRAERVARALAVGGVSINNVMMTEGNPALAFGGVKSSGFGRNKGAAGLHGFCNVKSVLIDKDSKKIEANWYPYTTQKYGLFSEMTGALFGEGLARWVRFARAGLKLEKYADEAGKKGRGNL
ncbi:MAG: acyl-CoA reductase-like NAD-dependent aldehyde dehydrogenase [Hyphomicrobiaceae bacterium]|jgi:acyl-CoA reductase-like NAD-dependent aldehyde dehydrogenase